MKKSTYIIIGIIILVFIMLFLFLTIVPFNKTVSPGKVKTKYWLSDDNKIMFWFPDEDSYKIAKGVYVIDDNTKYELIFKWDTKTGVVNVNTIEDEKLFTAYTETFGFNKGGYVCTFQIISQGDTFSFPDEINFNWQQNNPF